jgi:hypothetical protein
MQYVEVSDFAGVRMSVCTYRSRRTPLTFLGFPMIHVGEPQFYAEVERRLHDVDLVIAEGIPASPIASVLVDSYARTEVDDRLGLVVQRIDYGKLQAPVIRADVPTGATFEASWRRAVPLWQTWGLKAALPVVGWWHRNLATRRDLARYAVQEDLLQPWEYELPESFDGIMDVILDQRDRLLLEAVRRVHDQRAHEPLTVAVVWGAAHHRALTRGLYALGYKATEAEWLTVFLLDQE